MSYEQESWVGQYQQSVTPLWRMPFFFASKFVRDWNIRTKMKPYYFGRRRQFISESGMFFERKMWEVRRLADKSFERILVQGTGNGWDVIPWLRFEPKEVVGVDLFEFDSWPEIQREYKSHKTDLKFSAIDLGKSHTLGKFDLITSNAVYEHCTDLKSVIESSYAALNPGGLLHACYGPLYFCAGGDHFSGRDSLINSYNHLVLPSEDYADYVRANTHSHEKYQDGVRYIELDLFSKLKSQDYVNIYEEAGLEVLDLKLEVSRRALEYARCYPDKFSDIAKSLDINPTDLLIKAPHVVCVRPRS